MIEGLLFQHILKLILMMFVGFAAVKTKILKSEDSRVLSKLALFVIGPSAIISAFQVELNADVAGGLLEALIIAYPVLGLCGENVPESLPPQYGGRGVDPILQRG